ncbi:hypothetical protein H257_07560 [Aphanomyces astaci]|uniref:Uncharacterized protein n=1 Tax=Aphanomyces astaci TaxID=112090 RepID=W4GI55_APHAT|nr:hypothetical protein H257_07560 [Aphanomyces astaci]ETV78714.1 hypothetical protein H257_07560 [Aphanomyces astaci]|eukprot:XP_009831433.1 hypothetical protein H257_07560 [Aphanomyces astaci]
MNSSALSLKGSSELSLLVFNGKKDTFRVWSRKFMNYLEGLTIELTGLWIGESDKRPQPVTKFEDWLVSVPALHQSEIDATEKYKHYLDWYRKRQDQKVRSLLVEPRAPKNNVPCGAIRAEVPLPRQAEVPLPASTSPAEESLADYLGLGLDDDFEASSPYYTPAQERMEAVAGMIGLSTVDAAIT